MVPQRVDRIDRTAPAVVPRGVDAVVGAGGDGVAGVAEVDRRTGVRDLLDHVAEVVAPELGERREAAVAEHRGLCRGDRGRAVGLVVPGAGERAGGVGLADQVAEGVVGKGIREVAANEGRAAGELDVDAGLRDLPVGLVPDHGHGAVERACRWGAARRPGGRGGRVLLALDFVAEDVPAAGREMAQAVEGGDDASLRVVVVRGGQPLAGLAQHPRLLQAAQRVPDVFGDGASGEGRAVAEDVERLRLGHAHGAPHRVVVGPDLAVRTARNDLRRDRLRRRRLRAPARVLEHLRGVARENGHVAQRIALVAGGVALGVDAVHELARGVPGLVAHVPRGVAVGNDVAERVVERLRVERLCRLRAPREFGGAVGQQGGGGLARVDGHRRIDRLRLPARRVVFVARDLVVARGGGHRPLRERARRRVRQACIGSPDAGVGLERRLRGRGRWQGVEDVDAKVARVRRCERAAVEMDRVDAAHGAQVELDVARRVAVHPGHAGGAAGLARPGAALVGAIGQRAGRVICRVDAARVGARDGGPAARDVHAARPHFELGQRDDGRVALLRLLVVVIDADVATFQGRGRGVGIGGLLRDLAAGVVGEAGHRAQAVDAVSEPAGRVVHVGDDLVARGIRHDRLRRRGGRHGVRIGRLPDRVAGGIVDVAGHRAERVRREAHAVGVVIGVAHDAVARRIRGHRIGRSRGRDGVRVHPLLHHVAVGVVEVAGDGPRRVDLEGDAVARVVLPARLRVGGDRRRPKLRQRSACPLRAVRCRRVVDALHEAPGGVVHVLGERADRAERGDEQAVVVVEVAGAGERRPDVGHGAGARQRLVVFERREEPVGAVVLVFGHRAQFADFADKTAGLVVHRPGRAVARGGSRPHGGQRDAVRAGGDIRVER